MKKTETPHIFSLFSGGLDSVITARLLLEQGYRVTCLHFITPFFGSFKEARQWEKLYGLTIRAIDVSDNYIEMLKQWPEHGYGKVMNPCVDCKILMLRHAKAILENEGGVAIATGEVLGQRPMSQRSDALNIIQNAAGVKDILLRPLCAQHLQPTRAERDGIIDRTKLLSISGRGRKEQLALAKKFELEKIPSPAGGCKLAESEKSRNYWNILTSLQAPTKTDFYLTDCGRQLWKSDFSRLIIGRNKQNNEMLLKNITTQDCLFRLESFPGPLAVGRFGSSWSDETLEQAAVVVASYAPRAVEAYATKGEPVTVCVEYGGEDRDKSNDKTFTVIPDKSNTHFAEADWAKVAEDIRIITKEKHK